MGKSPRIEITEIFMAKAGRGNTGFDRCFHGTIRRERDGDGNPVVYGRIKVNDGYIIASASSQFELGEKLDELVLMILDGGLHEKTGRTFDISEFPITLN